MDEFFDSKNFSTNGTNCYGDFCVRSTLFVKIMGTFVFVAIWPFIVLDVKLVPLGRPAAALIGGLLMVTLNVATQEQVYAILGDKGHLQTLFLLIGMMMMSYYYDRNGILQYVSMLVFGKNRPFRSILWRLCALSAVLSAIITNDAACLVLTPLLLNEHTQQRRSKSEYPPILLGIATSANIGSSSTFFGNPQNAFIAANSKGQVSLLIFFVTSLPAAILGMLVNVLLLYFCYFRVAWSKKTNSEGKTPFKSSRSQESINTTYGSINNAAPEVEHSHSYTSPSFKKLSDNEKNYGKIDNDNKENSQLHQAGNNNKSGSFKTDEESKVEEGWGTHSKTTDNELSPTTSRWKEKAFTLWLLIITMAMFGLLAVPSPPVVPVDFNLGLVPMAAGILTMFVDTILNRRDSLGVIMKVDWAMILMFMGLFIWLGGFQNTLFPADVFQFLYSHMDLYKIEGVLLFTAFVVIGSSVLSNVPLVILVMGELFNFHCGQTSYCNGQLTGVLLAGISTIAGNFTLIGSVANLIVAEKAKTIVGYRLGFFEYLKFGAVSTVLVLILGVPILYFAGNGVKL